MPRSAENRSTISNHAGEIVDPAGLDLGQVQQVVDHLGELGGRGLDEARPAFLLLGQRPVDAVEQHAARCCGSSRSACGTRGSCRRGSGSSARSPRAAARPASSSAYSATTPRLVSSSSVVQRLELRLAGRPASGAACRVGSPAASSVRSPCPRRAARRPRSRRRGRGGSRGSSTPATTADARRQARDSASSCQRSRCRRSAAPAARARGQS